MGMPLFHYHLINQNKQIAILVTYIGKHFGDSLNLPGAQRAMGLSKSGLPQDHIYKCYLFLPNIGQGITQGIALLSKAGPISPASLLLSEAPHQCGF